MSHVRHQIREKFLALLSVAESGVDSWYLNRRYPIAISDGVAGLIFTGPESSQVISLSPDTVQRELPVAVSIRLKDVDGDQDEAIDDLASIVETRICTDITLGNLAKDVHLRSSVPSPDYSGGTGLMILNLEFLVTYNTTTTNPETAL